MAAAHLADRIPSLKEVVCDASQPLAKRFRAIFLLKNIGTKEAVDALSEGEEGYLEN